MAGTRLLLVTTVIVQILFLTGLALYIGSRHCYKNIDNVNHQFFVNREGLSILDKSSLDLSFVSAPVTPVTFFASVLNFSDDDRIDVSEVELVAALEEGLRRQQEENRKSNVNGDLLDDMRIAVELFKLGRDDELAVRQLTCRNEPENISSAVLRWFQEQWNREDQDGYKVLLQIGDGCATKSDVVDQTTVNMKFDHEAGSIFIQFSRLEPSQVLEMLRGPIAAQIHETLFPTTNGNFAPIALKTWKESALKVTVTLLQEAPSFSSSPSRSQNQKTNEEHWLLSRSLSRAMRKSMHPMLLNSLAPLIDFRIQCRSVLYGSLSSGAKLDKNEHHIVSSSKLKTFWDDHEQVLIVPRRFGSIGNFDGNLDLFLYVPTYDKTPLLVQVDKVTRSAFVIANETTAVSIVNRIDVKGKLLHNSTDTEEEHERAIMEAISYFGGFVRQLIGLSSQGHPSPRNITSSANQVQVQHALSKYGVGKWELDTVLRKAWPFKAAEAARRLRMLLELIDETSLMAVPMESAERINSSIRHFELAKKALYHDRNMTKSTSLLNISLRLAQEALHDGEMMEQLVFPWDHYLAVFAPLLMPLFLPFLVGLVREGKRYRKMVADRGIRHNTEKRSTF